MSRITGLLLLVLVLLGACASSVNAQISSVNIYTVPKGAGFYVDEQFYTSAVSLLWPAGSKHSIRTTPSQSGISYKTLYTYTGAKTNLGVPSALTSISADPGLTYVELDYTLSYAVDLSYFPCAQGDAACQQQSPGTVIMNGTAFLSDIEQYYPAGSTVTLEAYPSKGYIFAGWGLMEGVPKGSTFIWSFPLNQPQSVHPLFQTAQPIQVAVGTLPLGMQLLVDRTPIVTTYTYDWGWGTDHEVGAIPVQKDQNGNLLIFSSWSDGGLINHVYHVTGTGSSVLNLTATFVPGAAVSFLTSPPGLTLSVDGRSNWQNYNFSWAQGTMHSVSAPATQTDAQGHTYRFVSWSNGGTASQQYTVAAAPGDVRLTATYAPIAQVTLNSVPTGVALQVDGASCATPCTLQRDVGAQVNVTAPPMVPSGDGSRLVFQGWADSSNPTRTLTTTLDAMSLNAAYQMQYQLATVADPATGVVWSISPATADNFYNAKSVVSVSAAVNPGYQFLNWSGDATGATQPLAVMMSSPKLISVVLNPVPFIDPNGVKNAAGDTPEAIVAPGSVVSITGVNFAADQVMGPAAPLKQSIGGVTAHASGLLMPLFFISPTQVNAQLPFEIWEGQQTLTLSVQGKPDVNVVFTVARNAPGLFTNPAGGTAYVMASHADGTPVTADSPAAPGETVTVFGTGFGPYSGTAPDGFSLSLAPNWVLVDPVDVLLGSDDLQPTYAGTADQKVGVNAVSFVVPNDLTPGTNAPLQIKINGHLSNMAVLPLR